MTVSPAHHVKANNVTKKSHNNHQNPDNKRWPPYFIVKRVDIPFTQIKRLVLVQTYGCVECIRTTLFWAFFITAENKIRPIRKFKKSLSTRYKTLIRSDLPSLLVIFFKVSRYLAYHCYSNNDLYVFVYNREKHVLDMLWQKSWITFRVIDTTSFSNHFQNSSIDIIRFYINITTHIFMVTWYIKYINSNFDLKT